MQNIKIATYIKLFIKRCVILFLTRKKKLFEWNEIVQKMIDLAELHLAENPSLLEIANKIGYSPFYCFCRFHEITGMTFKSYIAGRRLAAVALEIRDTNFRILDIAIKNGYSSQEALTRAFINAFGCTPAAYRKNPVPIKLSNKQVVLFPEHYINKKEQTMNKTLLTEAHIRTEHIPAHKYIGIWDIDATDYASFFKRHDCDSICGIIDSMNHISHPIVTCHTAGWFYENGRKGYFYGFGVQNDYNGVIPDGFEIRDFPASDYLVFFHPPFDYLKDNGEVMKKAENLAWNFDPKTKGYEWNEDVCQDYQRHYPEVIGYEILRPIRKIKN